MLSKRGARRGTWSFLVRGITTGFPETTEFSPSMMKTMDSREKHAASTLRRVIPAEFEPEIDGALITLRLQDRTWRFLPIWIGEGLPADARRAVGIVLERAGAWPDAFPVVIANRVSPGAQEFFKEHHLSWADRSGRARILAPHGLFISRSDPIRADAGRTFAWSNAADAVAETLLTWAVFRQPDDELRIDRVAEIASATDLSLAHTARVLRQFDEVGYTAKTGAERGSTASRECRGRARTLSDRAGHGAATGGRGRSVEFSVPWRETDRSLRQIHEILGGVPWAVTGAVAADLVAPFLTSLNDLEFYVSAEHAELVQDLLATDDQLTEVESGGRVRVFTAEPHVLRLSTMIGEVDGVLIAPPVRVYADLLRRGGRSAEAAEHLREVRIGF